VASWTSARVTESGPLLLTTIVYVIAAPGARYVRLWRGGFADAKVRGRR